MIPPRFEQTNVSCFSLRTECIRSYFLFHLARRKSIPCRIKNDIARECASLTTSHLDRCGVVRAITLAICWYFLSRGKIPKADCFFDIVRNRIEKREPMLFELIATLDSNTPVLVQEPFTFDKWQCM